MSDLKKVKEWLQSRSILCKKGNMALIKRQVEVISITDVMAVLEMLEKNTFDEFILKMERLGYKTIEK